MKENTNAVFWIICGAIFVTTVYLIVATPLPSLVGNLFKTNTNFLTKTDNGDTPTAVTLKEKKSESDSFSVEFNKGKNASRYDCHYGTEKGVMNKSGVMYIQNDTVTCKAFKLDSNKKYYVQVTAINYDKRTDSAIVDVKTK